jgi:hypothetical protein
MQCYYCGQHIPHSARRCPHCGQSRSRLIYVHLFGVIGGLVGSFVGAQFYQMLGALGGGLLGIVLCEALAWWALRPHLKKS